MYLSSTLSTLLEDHCRYFESWNINQKGRGPLKKIAVIRNHFFEKCCHSLVVYQAPAIQLLKKRCRKSPTPLCWAELLSFFFLLLQYPNFNQRKLLARACCAVGPKATLNLGLEGRIEFDKFAIFFFYFQDRRLRISYWSYHSLLGYQQQWQSSGNCQWQPIWTSYTSRNLHV